jgi:Histidine kinase-, DNA gyrase B-, and HSP90-like ATPase
MKPIIKSISCFALVPLLFALIVAAEAQQPANIPRIGILGSGSAPSRAFLQVLEDLLRIFTGHDSDDWRPDETGLGLALATRFVEMHGGRLWVESQVGKGSRFFFMLPTS